MLQTFFLALIGGIAVIALIGSNKQAAALRRLRRKVTNDQRLAAAARTAVEDQRDAAERDLSELQKDCRRLAAEWEANQLNVCARQLRAVLEARQGAAR